MAELTRLKGLEKDLNELENKNSQEEEAKEKKPLASFFKSEDPAPSENAAQGTPESQSEEALASPPSESATKSGQGFAGENGTARANESNKSSPAAALKDGSESGAFKAGEELNSPNPQERQNSELAYSTGSKKLDEKIANKNLSLYELYALRRMGIDPAAMQANVELEGNLNLSQNIKKLSGDKEFESLKATNNAFDNVNSIIANADETSGVWNNFARGWSKATGHNFLSADEENQQRINDEAYLYANYLNAMQLRSGGTKAERDQIREAVNFGGLGPEQTRKKAISVYEHLMQRQKNSIESLKAKGYSEEMIAQALGLEGTQNFKNNQRAYDYLKEKGEDFDRDEFENIMHYGEYFKNKGEK